jgi:hypothetical protein
VHAARRRSSMMTACAASAEAPIVENVLEIALLLAVSADALTAPAATGGEMTLFCRAQVCDARVACVRSSA